MDNPKLIEIKNTVMYFYKEFKEELGDSHLALELTKEAMTTWRTLLLSKGKGEEKITENQYNLLQNLMGEFDTADRIMKKLREIGKSDISELTKKEASTIISEILSKKGH